MKSFYEPTPEHLSELALPWTAAYSGGKDSTSLVGWVEWLRRTRQIVVKKPRLVQADTGVEDKGLQRIAGDLRAALERNGWTCAVVYPEVRERLYNQILGRGLGPIHPGARRLRWCTRATKIDPMARWHDEHSSGRMLTGMRLGESVMRDGKLKKTGCSAGGECGIPEPSERTYSPIREWKTCQVIDWLNGHVLKDKSERRKMGDVFDITRRLVEIYDVTVDTGVFDGFDPVVEAGRFGCDGCPALKDGSNAPKSSIRRNGIGHPLNEIYDVWNEARRKVNRVYSVKKQMHGPIKIAVRKILFDRVMDIQARAGVVFIRPEDEAFIRQCWKDSVYPRGYSAADEGAEPPTPLFDLQTTMLGK